MAKETFDRSGHNVLNSAISNGIEPTKLKDVSAMGLTNITLSGIKFDVLKLG